MRSLLFFVLLISICFEVIFTKGETSHPNRPISRQKHVVPGTATVKKGERVKGGPVGPADRARNLRIVLNKNNQKK